ncbi:MAG: hypothetical protein IJO31_02885, partial [Oscillospiraceae bacterium]|nr:hypothetical protein [Oscillospiraceae bacterium]
MLSNTWRRCLSFLMAVFMVVSLMPVSALAADEESHDHSHEVDGQADIVAAEDPVATEAHSVPSNPLIAEYQERIDTVLSSYFSGVEMTAEAIQATVDAMDEMTFANWLYPDVLYLEEELIWSYEDGNLSEAEVTYIVDSNPTFALVAEIVYAKAAQMEFDAGLYTTISVLDDTVSLTDTSNNIANNSGTITATCKGSLFSEGSNTVTITNASGTTGTLSFVYSTTNQKSCTVDGTSSTSGTFSKTMAAGASVTIVFKSSGGIGAKTATLTITNLTFEAAAASSDVTFNYDSAAGSVTVGGTAVAAGGTVEIASSGGALKATAKSGATFLGWVDGTNKVISTAAEYTLTPTAAMTVQAVFATSAKAWFQCQNGTDIYLYDNLNTAITKVASYSSKVIVLASNGTLSAGTYTIPSGITLLIPYNSANTLCTTQPTTSESGFSAPTVYRKLTMADGASIVVNGALSLSATQSSSSAISSPIGACSFIQMNSGSTITVNNGGNLYAWGYIQGSGAVTVESGGTVYECFQIMDWRGGDNTTSMINNSQRVFPFSQYYVQNVEVPMTLKAGAVEKGFMSVKITLAGIQPAPVPFIGADGMFNIVSGYVVKDYDESTGRLLIDVYGNLSLKNLSMSMKLALFGSTTINSSSYTLPINGNMTVTVHSGTTTITQDLAMQPGVRFIVGEEASITLGANNKIFIYDYDEWIAGQNADAGAGPSFCGNSDVAYVNLKYPASAKTVSGRGDDAYIEVNGTVDLSAGEVYTTTGGANICGTGSIKLKAGAETKTYQVKSEGSDSKTLTYYDIPITSAKLKNADGTYTETASASEATTYNNCPTCGAWYVSDNGGTCETCAVCAHENVTPHTAVEATCTSAGNTAYWACPDCGKYFSDAACTQEIAENSWVTPNLGHTAAGTWSSDGTNHWHACSVCGEPADAPAAHSWSTASDGTNHWTACTVCNAEQDGSKVAHSGTDDGDCTTAVTCACGHVITAARDAHIGGTATCTEQAVCSVCSKPYGTKLPHTYEATFTWAEDYTCAVKINCKTCETVNEEQTAKVDAETTQPSCYQDGKIVYSASYTYEGTTYTASETPTKVLKATDQHNFSQDYTTEDGKHWQACTTSGCPAKQNEDDCSGDTVYTHVDGHTTHTAVSTCGVCGEEISNQTLDCADSDDEDTLCDDCGFDLHVHNFERRGTLVTPGNCQTEATYKGKCACGAESDTVIVTGEKDPETHTGNTEVRGKTDATCTVPGYTGDTHCADCDVKLEDGKPLAALGHTEGAVVVENEVAATCTAEGSYDSVVYCSVCGEELSRDTVTVDKLAHAYDAVVTAPTCTAKGYTTYTCSACGDSYVADETDMVDHTPAEAVKEN